MALCAEDLHRKADACHEPLELIVVGTSPGQGAAGLASYQRTASSIEGSQVRNGVGVIRRTFWSLLSTRTLLGAVLPQEPVAEAV